METGDVKSKIMFRLYIVYGLVAIAMAIVLIRVVSLQGLDPDEIKSEIATISLDEIQPMRGDICATDGRILATSMPKYTVHWDLSLPSLKDSIFENNVDSLAKCMSKLFGDYTPEDYARNFREARAAKKTYYLVKNRLSFSQIAAMRKFPLFNKGRYKSGFITEQEYVRDMPHKSLASRTIGYRNKSDNLVGLEGAYNEKLSGRVGHRIMMKLSSGDWIPANTYDEETEVDPEDGLDIISTLDVNIQDIVEKSLAKQLVKNNAKLGIAIVMEVRTGKIRAIANLDRYEDGSFGESFNHAIGTKMDPGSTFKLASLMACFEKKDIKLTDSVDLGDGTYAVTSNHTIRDDHKVSGYHSIQQIFEKSSNVGVSKLVETVFKNNPQEFVDRLYQMHLNKPTGIDIQGEVAPFIRYPGEPGWSSISMAQMSIGYEQQLTPLQTLTFYNAVANGGKMMKPHLLEAVRSHGEYVEIVAPEVLNSSICSKETLEKVQVLLRGVVDNGTARNIKNANYAIAGKTGTAQVADNNNGYTGGYLASFVGYFPADNPKYSCIVAITCSGGGSYYGSSVACPVFREIADNLFSHDPGMHSGKVFDLMKYRDRVTLPVTKAGDREILDRLYSTFNITMENVENSQTPYVFAAPNAEGNGVRLESVSSIKGKVPDVCGMGLRDAMYLLRERKMKVVVVGRGTVKKQNPSPGTVIKPGMTIVIELG